MCRLISTFVVRIWLKRGSDGLKSIILMAALAGWPGFLMETNVIKKFLRGLGTISTSPEIIRTGCKTENYPTSCLKARKNKLLDCFCHIVSIDISNLC